MTCPCCGAPGATRLTLLEGLRAQAGKVVSLAAFMSTAILGQGELIGEPWRHYVTIVGIVCTTLIAWTLKQHPVKEQP